MDRATVTIDDYALMRGIAKRDSDALGALYDRHASSLFPLCLRILGDWLEAQDVLTEVFWEVWNRCDRFDPARGMPITYLLTLTRSRAIDRRRSGGRRRQVRVQSDLESRPPEKQSSEAEPLQEAIVQELRGKIGAAMAMLSPAQRAAVELSFFDNLSHDQIAKRLSKPLGTVKTHIRQGLIYLREILRKDEGSLR